MYQKIMIAGMLSLLFLSACNSEKSDVGDGGDNNSEIAESQKKDDQDSVEMASIDEQDAAETSTQTAEETTVKEVEDAITFIKKQYTKEDIQVEYPQLPDADSFEAKAINKVIARDATYFFENGLYEGYSGEIKYETTFLDEKVASFLYQGLLTSQNQSYPINLSYSTIVNMQTGEKVTLSDLVTVDEAFVEKVKQGKILSSPSAEYSKEVKNYISSLGNEQLLNEISNADTKDSSSSFTYLADDSIVVIIGVPHALGDFVHVEIPK